MYIRDALKLSTRMFKTNPARTWLTILGMGVGTGAVVLLVGLGFGLQGILLERIVFGETLLSLNVTNPFSKAIVLDEANIESILKIPNVKDVSPLASIPALATFENLTGNITLLGSNASYFRYAGISLAGGNFFDDSENNRDKVILSSAALKLFNIEPEKALGANIKFRALVQKPGSTELQEIPLERIFTIHGIVEDPANISAFIQLAEFKARLPVNYYERAQVRVISSEFLTVIQEELVNRGFIVSALSKTVEQANKIFKGVQIILAIFGGIALIVSAIGMFNTMTVTLLERTAEIGIMRTIGAAPRDIMILFLSEAVIVGFLGGIIGILQGVIVGQVLNALINFVASRFGGTTVVLFRFPPLFLLFIAAFSAVVGFLTGIFPARRAAGLNPLDAIRYK